MIASTTEVLAHFLRLEASRPQYTARKDEILSWCQLPDAELRERAMQFSNERPDVNPVFVWTIGTQQDDRFKCVESWRRERIKCRDAYTSGISHAMRDDLHNVRGNIKVFALGEAKNYPEFHTLSPLSQITSLVIVIAHRKPDKDGIYEVVDGAHRLVAICRAGVEEVDAFVARLREKS